MHFTPIFCLAYISEEKASYLLQIPQNDFKNGAGTSSSNLAILDEFSEQHQHRSLICTFLMQISANLMHNFDWV
jgi:hypothetical protein